MLLVRNERRLVRIETRLVSGNVIIEGEHVKGTFIKLMVYFCLFSRFIVFPLRCQEVCLIVLRLLYLIIS